MNTSSRKKYLSRKLVAFIVNHMFLLLIFLVALFVEPGVLSSGVMITLLSLIVLNGITYIGGKALETWAKSRYFRSELVGK